jgi:hypothetical protein
MDKKTDEELMVRLASCPKAGSRWRHYKSGKIYYVQCAAISEATQEPLVVYHWVGYSLPFARPLSEWEETVEWEGQKVPRFRPV